MPKQNSTLQNKTKKTNWWLWLLIVLIILLIASAVMSALTPQPTKVPASQLNKGESDSSQTRYEQLEFTGQYPEVPERLPIAQTNLKDLQSQLVSRLTTQFSLQRENSGNLWLGEEYSFSLHNDGYISLVRNYNQKEFQDDQTTISLAEALTTAEDFLGTYLPEYQVTAFTNQAYLLPKTVTQFERDLDRQREPKLDDRAGVVMIPFYYSLAGYPIHYQENYLPFVEIVVGAGQGVVKASFNTHGLNYQTIDETSIISIDQAVLNITQKEQATIIIFGHEYTKELSLDQISSGELTTVQLEYRVDTDNDLIYPFYHFSGELINSAGDDFSAELITPAVEVVEK